MTSADFCPITPGIAPRRAVCAWLLAALFARRGWQPSPCAQACSTSGLTGHLLHHASHGPVGQISPDKNVNCRYTTVAFTLSPGTLGIVLLCQLARRLSLVCHFYSSARSFALRLPSDPASRRRPRIGSGAGSCLRLVLMLMISTINRIHVQGTYTP